MVQNTTKSLTKHLENIGAEPKTMDDGSITAVVPEDSIGRYFGLANRLNLDDGRRRVNGDFIVRVRPEMDDRNSVDRLFGR